MDKREESSRVKVSVEEFLWNFKLILKIAVPQEGIPIDCISEMYFKYFGEVVESNIFAASGWNRIFEISSDFVSYRNLNNTKFIRIHSDESEDDKLFIAKTLLLANFKKSTALANERSILERELNPLLEKKRRIEEERITKSDYFTLIMRSCEKYVESYNYSLLSYNSKEESLRKIFEPYGIIRNSTIVSTEKNLYQIGGIRGDQFLTTVQRHNFEQGLTYVNELENKRMNAGACIIKNDVDDDIFVVGGEDKEGPIRSIEALYLGSDDAQWRTLEMTTIYPRSKFGIVGFEDKFFCIFGGNGKKTPDGPTEYLKSAEICNTDGEVFEITKDKSKDKDKDKEMNSFRINPLGCFCDGWIYAIGGDEFEKTMEAYTESNQGWTMKSNMLQKNGFDISNKIAVPAGKIIFLIQKGTNRKYGTCKYFLDAYDSREDVWIPPEPNYFFFLKFLDSKGKFLSYFKSSTPS